MWSPFLILLRSFASALDGADFCVVVGYSFRDAYMRDFIGEALHRNRGLNVVVVAPESTKIVSELSQGFQRGFGEDRLHHVERAYGFFEKALSRNWLLHRLRKWQQQRESAGTPRSGRTLSQQAKALTGVSGMTYDAKAKRVYCTTPSPRGSVVWLDLDTSRRGVVAGGFSRARGIMLTRTHELIVVENEYRGVAGDPLWLQHIEGIGRLWSVSTATGDQRPLTHFRRVGMSPNQLQSQFKTESQAFWDDEHQLLNWPTAIALHPRRSEAYVTEARRLCVVDLVTGAIKHRRPIKLGFNVCGVQVKRDGKIVLLDGGVADSEIGTARILILNPRTWIINEVAQLPPFPASTALSITQTSVFVSFPKPFPAGGVVEFRLRDGSIRRKWSRLDRPTALVLVKEAQVLLVATDRGVIRLRLRR